jgi:hypothetical protein
MHMSEPRVPGPRASQIKTAIEKLKNFIVTKVLETNRRREQNVTF